MNSLTRLFAAPLAALLFLALNGGIPLSAEPAETITVATIQMPVDGTVATNLQRILGGIEKAAEAGARVVAFPETALSGFSREAIAALDWKELAQAEERIREKAKERGVYVIFGTATEGSRKTGFEHEHDYEHEKKGEGKTEGAAESSKIEKEKENEKEKEEARKPFNSASIVGPDGKEIARYHKLGAEAWFARGDHLELFEIDGVPCTIIICHDERFPEATRLPVLAGAKVCFYVSYEINDLEAAYRKAEGYRAQLIARAAENGIWVCQANGIGPLGDAPRKSLGQSRIVDPGGIVVQEAGVLEEAMLVQVIDVDRARRGNAVESLSLGGGIGEWWKEGLKLVRRGPEEGEPLIDTNGRRATGAAGEEKGFARDRGEETERENEKEKEAERDRARLALMRGVPAKWELEKNFAEFLKQIEAADRKGAEIFITPECWLDGYAAAAGDSTPEKLREIAQPLEGSKYLDRVAAEARERKMHICFGFTSLEGGKVFNSAGLWNHRGELTGVYHKTHLQRHDLQFEKGDALPVWQTPWGPVGIMICADRRWPETARTLRLKGARLILNPTYGMHGEMNETMMRTRGYENQCFIAFAHPEVGLVVDPKGGIAGKKEGRRGGVLVVDVDLSRAKNDNHLADRRGELYGPISNR